MSSLPDLGKRSDYLNFVSSRLEKQATAYQECDFHGYLQVSKDALKDKIMKLMYLVPDRLSSDFDIPIVVFGTIPIVEQCKRANISLQYDPNHAINKYPSYPLYLTWMYAGSRYINISAHDTEDILRPFERGAMQNEAVGLVLTHSYLPSILDDHFITFPGTVIDQRVVPRLSYSKFASTNYFELKDVATSHIHPHQGAATCYSETKWQDLEIPTHS
jgi:hypothetical protein